MKVIVIGAGSIGAHTAYRLAEQGAEVELLEASAVASGTTGSSIAWLSQFPQMAWDEEPGKRALRPQVHDLFMEVEQEVPGDYVTWSGTLSWGLPHERKELTELAGTARSRGVRVDVIDAAAARDLDPSIRFDDDEVVFWEPGSGWVDGPGIVRALIEALTARGGRLRTAARVTKILVQGGRVTGVRLADGEVIGADAVVNASGSWGSHVAAMADLAIPMNLVPGRVIYTEPYAGGPTRVLTGPTWGGRPDPDGGLAIHWRGETSIKDHGANIRSAEEVLAAVAEVVPALAGCKVRRSSVGIRPIPPDGPIVGALPWLPNFYFTLSHGGIGWGPMWGWAAARELLHGQVVPELAAMRPERFYLAPTTMGRYADDADHRPITS
ncbi:FAD-binding oxidoreductase [Kribbella hippodromi]|uniref:FAD-binding oxidoreductase n=1 Tax=Kribbella hippodromi TaxID=434347 RepID=A0ABP4PVN8_9ACTN